MPNRHVIYSLNSYIENPDPRYALMLKGKWGCGKTFLVNRWIEEKFKNPENNVGTRGQVPVPLRIEWDFCS